MNKRAFLQKRMWVIWFFGLISIGVAIGFAVGGGAYLFIGGWLGLIVARLFCPGPAICRGGYAGDLYCVCPWEVECQDGCFESVPNHDYCSFLNAFARALHRK